MSFRRARYLVCDVRHYDSAETGRTYSQLESFGNDLGDGVAAHAGGQAVMTAGGRRGDGAVRRRRQLEQNGAQSVARLGQQKSQYVERAVRSTGRPLCK